MRESSTIRLHHVLANVQPILDHLREAENPRATDSDEHLLEALRIVDKDLRDFVDNESFWVKLRNEWTLIPRPVSWDQVQESHTLKKIVRAVKSTSRHPAEIESAESVLDWLNRSTWGTQPSQAFNAHWIRPQISRHSYVANEAYETFNEAYLAKEVTREKRERARARLKYAAALLASCAAIYGFTIDALSAEQLLENIRKIAPTIGSLTDHMEIDAPTLNIPPTQPHSAGNHPHTRSSKAAVFGVETSPNEGEVDEDDVAPGHYGVIPKPASGTPRRRTIITASEDNHPKGPGAGGTDTGIK
jgi:hypothetical protein